MCATKAFNLHPRGAKSDIIEGWRMERGGYRLEDRQKEEGRMCFHSIPTLFPIERKEDLDN